MFNILLLFFKGGCYKFLSLQVNFIIIEIIMSLFYVYIFHMIVLLSNGRLN